MCTKSNYHLTTAAQIGDKIYSGVLLEGIVNKMGNPYVIRAVIQNNIKNILITINLFDQLSCGLQISSVLTIIFVMRDYIIAMPPFGCIRPG